MNDFLKTDLVDLQSIHTYSRPHGSKGEKKFIARFIDLIKGMIQDDFGNRILKIGKNPNILFSCHTDTAHMKTAKARQDTFMENDILSLAKPKNGYVLGADDGAGIWIALELIKAKIPGLYVFHRAEEIGGLGSAHIADVTPDILQGINIAIAFDRKGTGDIITYQGQRTASDTFAKTLAKAIPLEGFAPDDTGLFTDTANYAHLISECTNVSVGYQGAHTKNETLDVSFLFALRNALLKVNWQDLKPSRDPSIADPYDNWMIKYNWRDDPNNDWKNYDDVTVYDTGNSHQSMAALVEEYPDLVADLLDSVGITRETLLDEIFTAYGDY